MSLIIEAEKAPIRVNADGIALIGNTRIHLSTVISAFQRGDSPEEIVEGFESLSLADVYAVIAYYLRHRAEVEAYIAQQDAEATQLRLEMETQRPDIFSLEARLRKRKQRKS